MWFKLPGQEPAANTFALDLYEGLIVELDLVDIRFRHQIIYPMLCVCSTTDFESTALVVCQGIEHWIWDFSALTNSIDVPYGKEFVSCFNAKQ